MKVSDYGEYFVFGILNRPIPPGMATHSSKSSSNFKDILNNLNDLYEPHFDYGILSFRFNGITVREFVIRDNDEMFRWKQRASPENGSVTLGTGFCKKSELPDLLQREYTEYYLEQVEKK